MEITETEDANGLPILDQGKDRRTFDIILACELRQMTDQLVTDILQRQRPTRGGVAKTGSARQYATIAHGVASAMLDMVFEAKADSRRSPTIVAKL